MGSLRFTGGRSSASSRQGMVAMIALSDDLQPSDDVFAILGVSWQASTEEVRRAFRARARALHPDVNLEPDAAQQFRRLVAAFEVLSDEQQRAAWQRRSDAKTAWEQAGTSRSTAPAWRANASPPEGREKYMSLILTIAFIAGQWLVWYEFLTATARLSR